MNRPSPAWLAVLLCLTALAAAAATKKQPGCNGKYPTLDLCPRSGCDGASTPDGVINALKHGQALSGDPQVLTLADFDSLQKDTDLRFAAPGNRPPAYVACPKDYHSLSLPARLKCLSQFKVGSGTVSERDFVEVVGFLSLPTTTASGKESGPPKANTGGEKVNCNLSGPDPNDFHINVTPPPGKSEYDGIVVEMIPQQRDGRWNVPKLKRVQKEKRMVRVRGQLLLDGHHFVNADPQHDLGGQPKRFSLWEIHPVIEFDVCTANQCAPDSPAWKPLEEWGEGGKP